MEPKANQILQQAVIAHQQGKLEEAERLYCAILESQPKHPDANHNLGVLAVYLNKTEAALPFFKMAVEVNPKIEQFWLSYIDALIKNNQIKNAKHFINKAKKKGFSSLKLDALAAKFYTQVQIANVNTSSPSQQQINILLKYYQAGQYDDAEKLALLITQQFPKYQFSWKLLGVLYGQSGRHSKAKNASQKAVALSPQDEEARNNLGNTLRELGRLNEAESSYTQAIALKPDYAEAHNNLGNTLKELGRLDEAEASYTHAIALKPDYAEAYNNLGTTLKELGRLDEAEASYMHAIALKPDYSEVYNNLGVTFQELGRIEEALANYNEAIDLKVNFFKAYSNKNLCLNYSSNWTSLFIYHQHLEFEKQFDGLKIVPTLSLPVKKNFGERLRIGYVSGDFRNHSVAYFFEPLLQHHNANVVETFCYYNNSVVDATTKRLTATCDHWRSIFGIADPEVANLIRNDQIDILVDLSGHTAKNSLLVFAQRPAPIQVTWLGYPNTTGLSAIDYRFTDIIADPIGEADEFHSETLLRLPNGFHCYQGDETTLMGLDLPHHGCDHITFGSFNNLSKLTPEVIKVWSKILNALPTSRLVLKNSLSSQNISHYFELFMEEGITQDRIDYYSRLPSPHEHLELYSAIDIGLDPFPYNGVTTTCEALWMGVPVITLLGDRHAGRVGASILTNVGLTDFIAQDIYGYIQLAVEMAANTAYLQETRQGLRKRMQDSPLCDGSYFAGDIEKAYQGMWQTYLK